MPRFLTSFKYTIPTLADLRGAPSIGDVPDMTVRVATTATKQEREQKKKKSVQIRETLFIMALKEAQFRMILWI